MDDLQIMKAKMFPSTAPKEIQKVVVSNEIVNDDDPEEICNDKAKADNLSTIQDDFNDIQVGNNFEDFPNDKPF
jgi:hypothetical protein